MNILFKKGSHILTIMKKLILASPQFAVIPGNSRNDPALCRMGHPECSGLSLLSGDYSVLKIFRINLSNHSKKLSD